MTCYPYLRLALSPAGGHKLVHKARMIMELHRDWVCLKLDIENAQNAVSRASLLETVEAEPSLRHLSQHLVSTLAMPSPFESTGEVWGEAGDGLTHSIGDRVTIL